jgi:hypothetical protein
VNDPSEQRQRIPKDVDERQAIREAGDALLRAIAECGSSRELSLAKTNAEQAIMWAGRHFFIQENN